MTKLLVPLFALLLLPASQHVRKPAERLESAHAPSADSIQHQTREPAETVLYLPDYVDGGGWSV